MPTLFQAVIVSVFATNLPTVTAKLVTDANWSAIVSLPVLVIAYVVGLLAIASVEACSGFADSDLRGLQDAGIAPSYGKLTQEAEILSGSVVGFGLLGVAAVANTWLWPGWTRTLMFTAVLCSGISFLAWKMAFAKHGAASKLLRNGSVSRSPKTPAGNSGLTKPAT
jgi:hypothetical protein